MIFKRPVSGIIRWADIEALLESLGAEIGEAEGSGVTAFLFDEIQVFHRPHPHPDTDKGAVAAVREWLKANGVVP